MLSMILAAPVIVKVLTSLFLIIVINALTRQLLVAMAVATLTLAFWTGHSLTSFLDIATWRLLTPKNALLLIIIVQVIWLSTQMAKTGVMQDLVKVVSNRISRRASMAILPAVIGLLPMPGGAAFSAPLVGSCDPNGIVPAVHKTQANYWFRHLWEYWWPLYPAVLLAVEITGLSLWQFMAMQIPVVLLVILAGRIFILGRISNGANEQQEKGEVASSPSSAVTPGFMTLLSPILLTVSVYGICQLIIAVGGKWYPSLLALPQYASLVLGLTLGILWLQKQRPLSREEWAPIWFSRKLLKMILLVITILIYGAFIKAKLPGSQITVASAMSAEFTAWGIPTVLVLIAVPMICGLSMGIGFGFVGASLPIALALVPTTGGVPDLAQLCSYTVLAYAAGFMGMMLSPVHLCHVLTNEHFSTRISGSMARLLPPSLFVLAGAYAYQWLLAYGISAFQA